MEIVINVCFGGFGLSDKALVWIAKESGLGIGDSINNEDWDKYPVLKNNGDSVYSFNKYYANLKVLALPTLLPCEDYNEAIRKHPLVIKSVRLFKSGANAECSKLKIVEIPDNIEWSIKEYDGNETIEEKHRSWG